MAAPQFRFVICPVNSTVPLGELPLGTVAWNDPVSGTGGSFSGKLEIPSQLTLTGIALKDKYRDLTTPWTRALYVLDNSTGQYLFGGPIVARPWSVSERRLVVQVISWKSWLYMKMIGPNTATNPPTDVVYTATATDQFSIARTKILVAVNADVGCPLINLGTEMSGVTRDYASQGSQFKFAGDLIDSMANRDNGFDWSITTEPDSFGNPVLWFRPYWPKRGNVNTSVVLFHQLPNGANILALGDPQDSASQTRTRTWASGAGQPPDLLFAYDQDPALASDGILLSERVDSYTTVTDIAALANHARSARAYFGAPLQQVSVKMALDSPDYKAYSSGDRIHLIVQDEWLDWDYPNVRIVDRVIRVKNEGESSDVDTVTAVIDLNDAQLPENDTQV